jgi:hypothetical protein
MAAHIPDAEFMMVPQGTHVAPLEHRDLVELRVERFLREHLPDSPPATSPSLRASTLEPEQLASVLP